LFLWLGYAIYGDKFRFLYWTKSTRAEVEQLFQAQRNVPGYKAMADVIPITGIWDDHDFGLNDGGKNMPEKEMNQELFLDFLGVHQSSPRRKRSGTYDAFVVGPPGNRVQIILLDTRYFKDEYREETEDILGEDQWRWLQEQLKEEVDLRIIGSGIQVIPTDKLFSEKWFNLPKSRRRLFGLLRDARTSKVTGLISGDVHYAELLECQNGDEIISEITSSGITHTWPFNSSLTEWFMASQYSLGKFFAYNFGSIEIDWKSKTILLQAHGENGVVGLEKRIDFSSHPTRRILGCMDLDSQQKFWIRWPVGYWLPIFQTLALCILLLLISLSCKCWRWRKQTKKESKQE
jgi:alkaline phosphatase D